MNLEFCRQILQALQAQGVNSFCVCAGSRNSPLIVELLKNEDSFQVYNFFEERSAAFFALGLARRIGKPVGVVTTSGTAVAELLPATIEAYYSGVPLLLLTADRPRHFRGTGAPQSIEQKDMFGPYVEDSFDLAIAESVPDFTTWSRMAPLHVNVCLDEPLLEKGLPPARPLALGAEDFSTLEKFLGAATRPLVMLAGLEAGEATALVPFLKKFQAPIWAEATSQLREEPTLQPYLIRSGERILKYADFDAILRIGGVPQCRFWRDLETTAVPVLVLSKLNFRGLSRGDLQIEPKLESYLSRLVGQAWSQKFEQKFVPGTFAEFFQLDKSLYEAKLALFAEEPRSEPALMHSLSRLIPEGARIFLGNSLPIREWDLAAVWKKKNFRIGASRGANGIDGQLSTFLGWMGNEPTENWGLFGDLTTLYDLTAPWALRLRQEETPVTLVVINNQGGKIFSRLGHLRKHLDVEKRERLFENTHHLDFEAWARMWNLGYEKWERIPSQTPGARQSVIEIVPDNEATERFWDKYQKLFEGLS